MLTEQIRHFVTTVELAFVASADAGGNPHLAAGRGLQVLDDTRIAFEAWFCPQTLRNVAVTPRVAVAVVDSGTGTGYQFAGTVTGMGDTAFLDGCVPGGEPAGMPQVRSRLVIEVDRVMAFAAEVHTDTPLT